MHRMTSISVWRNGALGDFILTSPALQALRSAHPVSRLRLIGPPELVQLVEAGETMDHNAAVLAPLFSPSPLPKATAALLAREDVFLAYSTDPEGVLAGHLSRHVPGLAVVHDPRPPADGTVHACEHLLAPVAHLGLPTRGLVPLVRVPADGRSEADRLWQRIGLRDPVVVVHPGSGGRRKCWPVERFAHLIAALRAKGISVLGLHGPAEADLAGQLGADVPRIAPPGIAALAGILARAGLFVGNDAGPGHLAAALGVPTLSLFGPTDPRIWRPLGPRCRVLRAPSGRLDDLGVDQVAETALELSGRAATPPDVRLHPDTRAAADG